MIDKVLWALSREGSISGQEVMRCRHLDYTDDSLEGEDLGTCRTVAWGPKVSMQSAHSGNGGCKWIYDWRRLLGTFKGLECQAKGFRPPWGSSGATVTIAMDEEGIILSLEERQSEVQILGILLSSWWPLASHLTSHLYNRALISILQDSSGLYMAF